MYHALVSNGGIAPGLALDDGVAAHFIGEDLHKTVSSREEARAYRVTRVDGSVNEATIDVEHLPKV